MQSRFKPFNRIVPELKSWDKSFFSSLYVFDLLRAEKKIKCFMGDHDTNLSFFLFSLLTLLERVCVVVYRVPQQTPWGHCRATYTRNFINNKLLNCTLLDFYNGFYHLVWINIVWNTIDKFMIEVSKIYFALKVTDNKKLNN